MNHLKKVALSIIFLLPTYCSYAAENDRRIDLAEVITQTLANNPQFQIYQLRQQALNGDRQTAALKPALRFNSEVENIVGTGDLSWFQGMELTLALFQVIELGDKRLARSNTANQRLNQLLAEQQVMELDLLSQATSRYIEVASAEAIANLLARSTQLANDTFASISTRVEAGRAPEAERARAAAALARAELAQQSATYNSAAARIILSSLWGSLEPDFVGTDAALMQLQSLPDIDSLLSALETNPAIAVFASESRLREAQLREATSLRRPDIEVGAGIRHLAELNDSAFMFQVNMPLSSRRRASGAITAAQANLLRVDAEKETALLRMKAQLLSLHQQNQLVANEFNTLQNSIIPQLQIAFEETRTAFENGRYSYLELSAAQKELLDAQLSLIEVATRAHLLRVEIERLSGVSFTSTTTQAVPDRGL